MQIYDTHRGQEFKKNYNEILYVYEWDNYDDWVEKYSPETHNEAALKIHSLMSFYEGIGVLVEQKLIDIKLVNRLIYPAPKWIWDKMEPIIKERRKHKNTPQMFEWFEYLIRESEKYEKSHQ